MKGGWHTLVNDCVEIQAYPTVLFYEQVDQARIKNLDHGLSNKEIESLAQVATSAGENAFNFFSQEEIELQHKLLNNPGYEIEGKGRLGSIYGVYFIVRDQSRDILCQEFR